MKEFLVAHTVEAIGMIIAAITAIGVFVGPWLASRRQRKNMEQDRRLRVHFEELKRGAELIVSSASNLARMARDSSIVVAVGSQAVTTSDIDEVRVSRDFGAHFPEQAQEFSRLKRKIREHNVNCEDLRREMRVAFESEGIPIEQNDQGKLPIFILETSLDALFERWISLAQNKCPVPDFKEIGFSPVPGGYKIFTGGWGGSATVFVFGKTEDELEEYKLALYEILANRENQRKAAEILDSANELIGKAKEFADQLASELNDISEFWKGKKGKQFEKLKKTCLRCRELF